MVLFKKWSPLFDAIHEKMDVFPVWVRAPGLPSFLWVESVFRAIGNRLGTFLEADMPFLQIQNREMAWILVSLNRIGGLAEKINLQYKDYVFEQILDYEYLPFRCHRCHVYGHLAKECPLGRRQRRFQRTTAHLEKENNQNQPLRRKETSVHQIEEEMEMDPQQGRQTPIPTIQDPPSRLEGEGFEDGSAKTVMEPIKEATKIQSPTFGEDSKGTSLAPKNPLFLIQIKNMIVWFLNLFQKIPFLLIKIIMETMSESMWKIV